MSNFSNFRMSCVLFLLEHLVEDDGMESAEILLGGGAIITVGSSGGVSV